MMKLISSLLLMILAFSLNAQNTEKYKEIDQLISTGSTIDAMTARNKLKENFKKDTLDAEYWLRYSRASSLFYKPDDAKAAINKAIKLNPEKAEYYYEKGVLYNRTDDPRTALDAFSKAAELSPEGKYIYWRGILNQRTGRIESAEKDYKSALAKKYETPELYNNLSIILASREEYGEALTLVNKAIQMNPLYSQAYATRAQIGFSDLRVDSACKDLQTSLRMQHRPSFDIPDSICNGSYIKKIKYAADLLAYSKRFKSAIKAYTLLIESNELKSEYFLNRGYCYYLLKDYVNAEKDYLNALTFPSTGADIIYNNLSLLYFDTGNYQKAVEWASKRIELNANNHLAYLDRGLSYRKLKKFKEAEKDFNKALSIKPDFYRAYGYRAFLYLETGDYEKSFEDAAKSVRINQDYSYGYLVLGQAKQKLKIEDYCVDFIKARELQDPDAEAAISEFCK